MKWQYGNKDFNPVRPVNSYGFIYKIVFESEDCKEYEYIGKKSFWKQKTLQPLKGYKRKRKSMVESDWESYVGSCKESNGMIPIRKEIIMFCNSKRDLTYYEEDILFERAVLFDTSSLNANIGGRHFKGNLNLRQGEWIKWYEGELNEQ